MKVITLISQKGGSGKTTISISLGCEAESRGKATVIIDTDPQGSIHKWSKRREDDIPDVVTAHAVSLDDLLRRYDEAGADFAIIDTAGSLSADIVTIAKHSDLILIPSRPAVVDLDAIEDSINISRLANKPAYVVFNAVHPKFEHCCRGDEGCPGRLRCAIPAGLLLQPQRLQPLPERRTITTGI